MNHDSEPDSSGGNGDGSLQPDLFALLFLYVLPKVFIQSSNTTVHVCQLVSVFLVIIHTYTYGSLA